MIKKIEFLSARAIPCLDSVDLDGWELRFAGGLTRRTNSVNVMAPGRKNSLEKVRICEKAYQDRNQPCHFRICQPGIDDDLDRILAEQGYDKFDPTDIRLLDLKKAEYAPAPDVKLADKETDQWLADVALLTGQAPATAAAFAKILTKIPGRKICAAARQDGRPVACGLAVVEDGFVGLFEIATAKTAQRQGIAKRLAQSLLAAGKSAGATTAYLQVVHANGPGNAFWNHMGFSTPLYSYHYRSKIS